MIDLAELLDDQGVRAQPDAGFDDATAERLGRALGTLARRRGQPHLRFAVGADKHGPERPLAMLRRGLVRGVLQCGHDVLDSGVVADDAWEQSAREAEHVAGAYIERVGDVGRIRLLLFCGLGQDVRSDLAEIFARGDFFAGIGRYDEG